MSALQRLAWTAAAALLLPVGASAQLPLFVDGFESGDTSAWSQGEHGPTTVTLIVIGDTGEGNVAQSCVATGMSSRCQAAPGGCTAVLMGGDNFFDDGVNSVDDPQWTDKFEVPYNRPGLAGVPFYPVLGDVDYDPSNILGSGSKQAQIDYSFLPVGAGVGHRASDKWHLPAAWYDVAFGGGLVHVFALDTQDTAGAPPMGQAGDMQARVAASTAPWKIVVGHYPRFTSGDHQADLLLLNLFSPSPGLFALQRAVYCGADLYVSAHDSNRELIAAGQDATCPNSRFLISGAAAKVVASDQPLLASSLYFDDTTPGFFLLEITASGMRVESWDNNAGNCAAPVLAFDTVIPN